MASEYVELQKGFYQDTGNPMSITYTSQAGEFPEWPQDTGYSAPRKRSFSDYLESSDDLEAPISKLRRITISPPIAEPAASLITAESQDRRNIKNANLRMLNNWYCSFIEATMPGSNFKKKSFLEEASLSKNEDNFEGLFSNIQPDDSHQNPAGPLDALRYPLYKHQLIALEWMKKMELDEKKRGGILADDMGLGKTLSTIALMVSRDTEPYPWSNVKTNLIIAPVSLLKQWEREIKQKVLPGYQLKVFIQHSRRKDYDQLRDYDVVLTSYGLIVSEVKKRDRYIRQAKKEGREVDENYLSEICPFLSQNSLFYRVILDEAQYIKNPKAKVSKAVCELQAKYRWCLTGTPMQNGPNELASLVRFLGIKPYDVIEKFQVEFKSLQPGSKGHPEVKRRAMKTLQSFLKDILLRRTKQSKIDGKPIIQLKEKTEVIDHVVFDTDEQEYYATLEKDARVQFSKYLRAGTVGKHYTKVLILLLRLRQACCHPYLHLTDLELIIPDIPEEQAAESAKTLPPEVVEHVKGTEIFQCSVCSDVVSHPSIMCPCGDLFCSPCAETFMNILGEKMMRAAEVDQSVECTACHKQGKFTIIKFDSFLKTYQPERLQDETELGTDDTDDDADDSDDDYEADLKPDKLVKLCQRARHNQRAHKRYMRTLRGIWQPSAKVAKCCELISTIQNTTGEKIIVFSQWTIFLDLIQISIEDELGLRVGRYDGSMTATKRDKAINEFTEDPEVKVILVSLKAGNAGLNLTVASQVIIMDPFWNPYVENQAIDRTYRIGQQRDVTVHRLLVEKTVEDRIMATQEKKRRVVEFALQGEKAIKDMSKLGTEDLAFLFGMGS
ncbi:SNF2 family N-terminal domain-containing protein [Daldinia vernicosa]|uniref:SNF2 family N-terminal domain-containing protein n=1 Tax=Daldinia vernicosa TaxID=114800 RepID=UPI0020085702|nr:SNF2 family N-terminal domain-containing protein [Daldinia vernicosa]KAI0847696.1 SNF2 family N-terminal domain-containing protein [Daldinia vernicosa]